MRGEDAKIMEPAAFFAALRSGTLRTGAECRAHLATAGDGRRISLPVRLVGLPAGPLRGRPLVVNFSGSVDQKVRGFPHYGGGAPKRAGAVALSVADPSLWLATELRTAWYQPNALADVPAAIAEFIAAVAVAIDAGRVIFAGNSNGAHAALVQAARMPGSIAIALSPITRIPTFYKARRTEYLRHCWPGVKRLADLPSSVVEDCGALYRDGHEHAVILLANATDPHLASQALAFASQVRDQERLLFLTEFFPEAIGHTLPVALRGGWITAAALAPTAECRDIARTHAALAAEAPAPATGGDSAPHHAAAPRDLDLAARIAAAALQE